MAYNPAAPDITNRLDAIGNTFTTKSLDKAARDDSGNPLVVRTDFAKAQAREAGNSSRFLKNVASKGTTWWKRINVGYTPRTVVNNSIGNWFMYAMKEGGHGGMHGFLDALKEAHGNRAAMNGFEDAQKHILETQGPEEAAKFTAAAHPALSSTDSPADAIRAAFGDRAAKAVTRPPSWINKHFKSEIGNTFGNAQDLASYESKAGIAGKLKSAAQSGFYPIVHRVADQPVRVASLYNYVRRSPEVKAFLRDNPGTTVDEAADRMLTANTNHLQERAVAHVRSIAGDYTTPVHPLVRTLMPFYLWDKHIVNHLGSMASEQPGRLALTQQVSRMGNDEVNKLLGSLPSYLGNVLPLSLLGLEGHNDRKPVLTTSGINPYATAGDLAKFGAALTTGSGSGQAADAAGELSPILGALAAQLTGHAPGSEAAVPTHGGVVPSVVGNVLGSMGYGALIKKLLGDGQGDTTKSGKPTIYSHSTAELLSSLLGIPIKQLSPQAASAAAAREQPHKSYRRQFRSERSAR